MNLVEIRAEVGGSGGEQMLKRLKKLLACHTIARDFIDDRGRHITVYLDGTHGGVLIHPQVRGGIMQMWLFYVDECNQPGQLPLF